MNDQCPPPSIVRHPRAIHQPCRHSQLNGGGLVKGVGPGAPPGEEAREADRLEHLGNDVEADGVDGPLLDEQIVEVM